jgi:hypothetical protein
VNLLDLRQAGLATQPHVRATIESALTQIGAHFRQRLERPDIAPAPTILHTIDRTIAALRDCEAGRSRVQGLTAATGLRLGLFPLQTVAANATAP